jgi:hypothetical protein
VTDQFLSVARLKAAFTGPEVRVLVSTRDYGAGYRIIQAFESRTAAAFWLTVAMCLSSPPKTLPALRAPPLSKAIFTGREERDSYTPENDVAGNTWYARDVPTLAQALGTEEVLHRRPLKTAPKPAQILPLPLDTSTIPNRHLRIHHHMVWIGRRLGANDRLLSPTPTCESEAMKYISTRGQAPELTFEDAMLTGLARDGGLYLPDEIPTLSKTEIAALSQDSPMKKQPLPSCGHTSATPSQTPSSKS